MGDKIQGVSADRLVQAFNQGNWTAAPGRLGAHNLTIKIDDKEIKVSAQKLMQIATAPLNPGELAKITTKADAAVVARKGTIKGKLQNTVYKIRNKVRELRTGSREKVYKPLMQAGEDKPITLRNCQFDSAGEEEVLGLQKMIRTANPEEKGKINLSELKQRGLLPSNKFQLQGVTYYCSSPFKNGSNYCSLAFVQIGKRVYPRLFYLSNSQGNWRVAPNYAGTNLGKGKAESDTQLPIALSLALHQLPRKSVGDNPLKEVGPGSLPFTLTESLGMGGISEKYARTTEMEQLTSLPEGVASNFNDKGLRVPFTPTPDRIPSFPGDHAPDFTQGSSFPLTLELYGQVTAKLYPSKNGEYQYMFYELPSGHAYLALMEKTAKNPLNKFGVRRTSPEVHHADAPLIEYWDQIPTRFNPQTFHYGELRVQGWGKNYTPNWNYVREIPLIQAYYAANNRPLPEAI